MCQTVECVCMMKCVCGCGVRRCESGAVSTCLWHGVGVLGLCGLSVRGRGGVCI